MFDYKENTPMTAGGLAFGLNGLGLNAASHTWQLNSGSFNAGAFY